VRNFASDARLVNRTDCDVSVNTYHHINQLPLSTGSPARAKQEREFQIASIGLSDSTGILLASILAVPTELALCAAQVSKGRTWCRDL
jgi:battenin